MFPEEVAVPLILGLMVTALCYRGTQWILGALYDLRQEKHRGVFAAYSEKDLRQARDATAAKVRRYTNDTSLKILRKEEVRLLRQIDREMAHRGISPVEPEVERSVANVILSPNERRQQLSDKWVKAPTPPKPVLDSGVGNSNYGLTYLNGGERTGMPLEEAGKILQSAMKGDVVHLPHGAELVRNQYADGVIRGMRAYVGSDAEESTEDVRMFGDDERYLVRRPIKAPQSHTQ